MAAGRLRLNVLQTRRAEDISAALLRCSHQLPTLPRVRRGDGHRVTDRPAAFLLSLSGGTRMNEQTRMPAGVSRRTLLARGAMVGGALWAGSLQSFMARRALGAAA